MLNFSKIKIVLIYLLFLILGFFSFLNFQNENKTFLDKKVNLGLDLQGGSYLLLEVDTEPLIKERLQSKVIPLKKTLNGNNIISHRQIKITTFNNHAAPFSLSFESKSGTTYIIEASHDLKKWGNIGETQGTGSSVELTDWREALFQKQYYRLKLVE